MRPCFSTLGCPALSFAEVGELAARHAVLEVELRGLGGSLDLPGELLREFGAPKHFAAAVRAAGLHVPVLGTSLCLLANTEENRRDFLAYLPWAEALGGAWLRVFDGGSGGLDPEAVACARDTLAWWRAERARRRWRTDLIVETHDTLLRGETLLEFDASIPGVRLLWDAHHTWLRGGEAPEQTWRIIAPRVAHIHVKDSMPAAASPGGRRLVVPGLGEYPFASLRRALVAASYSGALCLEWERYWAPDLPRIEEPLRAMCEAGWW